MNTATVKSGRNADINSPFSQFTPDQRAKLQDYMQGFYDNFVEKVATARHTTPERIDAVAQGRVWTGAQARERGLVDMLGGLDTAVAIAKERAKIPADEDVELVVYPRAAPCTRRWRSVPFLELQRVGCAGRRGRGKGAGRATTPARSSSRRGEPLALMPFTFIR